MKKTLLTNLKYIAFGLVVIGMANIAAAFSTWSGPVGTLPGTSGFANIGIPVNVGTVSQTKEGGLSVNTFSSLQQAAFNQQVFINGTVKGAGVGPSTILRIGGTDSLGTNRVVSATVTGGIKATGAIKEGFVAKTTNNGSTSKLCATSYGTVFLCGTTAPGQAVVGVGTPAAGSCTINFFSANPTAIQRGYPTTLNWSTVNCTGTKIDGQAVAASGSMSVSPTQTRTYVLTTDDPIKTASVAINVTQGCTINSFTTNKTTLLSGESATLSWNTTNCAVLSFHDSPTHTFSTQTAASGTMTVSPTANTSYRLYGLTSLSNTNNTDEAFVNIAVTPLPPVNCVINSFSAAPTTVATGGMTMLSWSLTGCTGGFSIEGTPFTWNQNGTGTSSTYWTIATPGVKTITLVANGAVNTATATTQVTATDCMIDYYTADANPMIVGAPNTLRWSTTGCGTPRVNGIQVSLIGTMDIGSLSQNATYNLTFTDPTKNRSITVAVTCPQHQIQIGTACVPTLAVTQTKGSLVGQDIKYTSTANIRLIDAPTVATPVTIRWSRTMLNGSVSQKESIITIPANTTTVDGLLLEENIKFFSQLQPIPTSSQGTMIYSTPNATTGVCLVAPPVSIATVANKILTCQ